MVLSPWSKSLVAATATAALLLAARPAGAQDEAPAPDPQEEGTGRRVMTFLGGAATGLATHEAGHLLSAWLFDARPSLKAVDFAGIPFFAITHRPGLSPRREFTVSAAGFWAQHGASELLLTRRPRLRDEHAPFAKGWLAFHVLASVAYSGAAAARVGPFERDTRAMSDALDLDEPWVGLLVLVPAVLDAYRYFRPDSRWAAWSSRGVKVGLAGLVIK